MITDHLVLIFEQTMIDIQLFKSSLTRVHLASTKPQLALRLQGVENTSVSKKKNGRKTLKSTATSFTPPWQTLLRVTTLN